MSRDYAKKKKSRKKSNKSNLGLWMVLLLSFTMFVGALIFISNHRYNKRKLEQKFRSAKQTISESIKSPKFDFYRISPKKKTVALKNGYELGIATVSNFAKADRLKAELTLSGFMVNITPKSKQGTKKYYVSVGPYKNEKIARRDQKRLKLNKINSKLRKTKF